MNRVLRGFSTSTLPVSEACCLSVFVTVPSIAARRMAAIPGPGRHRHFNYMLRYNAVTMKEVQFKKCPGDAGAYFNSATHCIYIHQTKNINKKASAAKNESISELVSIDTIFPRLSRDITEYEDKVFNKATLQMVLTSKVIPEKLANDISDLWSSITSTAKTVSLQGEEVCIAVNLQDLNAKFKEVQQLLGNASKDVLHEIQLNRWLYSYVSSCLNKLEYVVESRRNNVRCIGEGFLPEEVNEYAMSRGDLVIYKCTGLQVKGCLVQLVGAETDVEHVECLSGLVTELKIDDTSNSPVWECFHDMSAVGATLTMRVLKRGKVVDKVCMYGIVAVVKCLEQSKLLCLEMDYHTGQCHFKECVNVMDFDILMNIVIGFL